MEIYSDAQTFGLKAGSSKAVSNANLAISWLEATFPELARQAAEGGNQPALKAHPYALFDASVALQVSLLGTGGNWVGQAGWVMGPNGYFWYWAKQARSSCLNTSCPSF